MEKGSTSSDRETLPSTSAEAHSPARNSASDAAENGFKFDQDRVKQLYEELDVNKDGRIDIQELTDGLHKRGLSKIPGNIQRMIKEGDTSKDNQLSFDEFLQYCRGHEQQLWLVFKKMDANNSGSVSKEEILTALKNIGVKVTDQELQGIISRMDTDGSLQIEWDEWRNFHFLNTQATSLENIIRFWKHSSFIDIGDAMVVPDDFTEEEKVTGMWWRQLVAGGVAGVVSRTCTAPLDRLKVMLQVQAGSNKQTAIASMFKKMLQEGGVMSLWQGNGVNTLKIAPESSIKFFAYERIKTLFMESKGCSDKQLNTSHRLIAGSLAGICSQTAIYPMEVMKTRLAIAKKGQYAGMFDCARSLLKNEGPRVFYKGLTPGLLGIIPYAGIDLCVYETLKQKWIRAHANEEKPGNLVLLLCGSTASTCGQIASYPLALVRTKLQAQTKSREGEKVRATTTMDMFKVIVREDGLKGLYRGMLPNFMKVLPAVSISYVVYENCRQLLGMS